MATTRRQFLKTLALLAPMLGARQTYSASNSVRHMRAIPSSGEQIPAVGLGSWLTFAIDVDDEQALARRVAILREFLTLGAGMLDSSPMYGVAQKVIGLCLQRIGESQNEFQGNIHDDIQGDIQGLFSATKVWTRGSREGLLQMEDSRLLWGVPNLDLMQVHNLVDWETHIPTLQHMKKEGLIRYVGVTTSHGRRHKELMHIMRTQPLDFVQFTYNILDRDAERYLLPLAQERGMAVIINRPFQRGGLFDKFETDPLPEWASEIDCANWAQFFLKFIISHPAVSCAIPATSQLAHLRENMDAAVGRLPDQPMRRKMIAYVDNL